MNQCTRCGAARLVFPLHGVDKGGPLVCPDCAFTITNRFNPERDRMLWLLGRKPTPPPTYMTLELLRDILQLVHPDKHPPERAALANRVAAELNRLKPFTAPAPKPKPPPPVTDKPPSTDARLNIRDAARSICLDCIGLVPAYYCAACRAQWDEKRRQERERERTKQREAYARRQQLRRWYRKSRLCAAGCGTDIKALRTDAKFCSPACRQRAHRRGVTDTYCAAGAPSHSRAEAAP